jgi:hypothetical protein
VIDLRKTRTVVVGALAATAIVLGLATPAQAATAKFSCHTVFAGTAWCTVKVGVANYNAGQASLDYLDDGNGGYDVRIRIQPAGGFTLVLRVFPNEGGGGYIDYRVANNGRKLSYPVDWMQVWVQGHDGISPITAVNSY